MNLLPAVEAYIAERRAQLSRRNPVPVEILRELESISGLCLGLNTQAEILDKPLAPVLAEPKPGVVQSQISEGGRDEYEMTTADLVRILDAYNSIPMIGLGLSSREREKNAWAELGKRMGFDPTTVRSVKGKGKHFFTATPSAFPTYE